MRSFSRSLVVGLFLVSIVYGSEPGLRAFSPGKKYQLVVEDVPRPDAPDAVWTSISVSDANGKMIRQLYTTEFPIDAIKWHKSADAAIIMEHIARQEVMELVLLRNGLWQHIEVNQFKTPPGYFHLVEAKSGRSSFECYYLGHNRSTDEFTAYRTEVNVITGEATLKAAKHIDDEDLPFYKQSLANILYQMENASKDKPLSLESWPPDEQANWYGVRR